MTDSAPPPPSLPPSPSPSHRLVWRQAEVREIVVETARAKSLVLRVPGWTGHSPGQHVDVRLTAEDGYQAQRSYSIASAPAPASARREAEQREVDPREVDQREADPREADQIVLTVERLDDGEVSPFLTDELRAGDKLELRGPIGGYFIWTGDNPRPLQLLAGGSGIVPLMAMLRHRARVAPQTPARLLYSSRTWDTTIYRDELRRLSEGDPRLTVSHALTRERPAGWTGEGRRVDGAMLRARAYPPRDQPEVFVCGPTPFVESVANALVDWGHAADQIKTERFGPTGGTQQSP